MNLKHTTSIILFISIIFFSCNSSREKSEFQTSDLSKIENHEGIPSANKEKNKIPVGNNNKSSVDSASTAINQQHTNNIDWDKKIIKTATLTLEIKDFLKFNDFVHKTVKQFGGYIAQEEQNLTDNKSETIITIKVPVDQFETMMNQLPASDVKIIERKITTDDVTGEVVDVKSRLESKKQMRLKYLEFLKQSKNMEEALQVQGEVNNIQEEIEAAANRVEYLNHQSAMSTIKLTFYKPIDGFEPPNKEPNFFGRIANAFKSGADWIADILVGLISIWPLIIILAGAIIVYKKMWQSKKQPV